jgi:hypothetical protein
VKRHGAGLVPTPFLLLRFLAVLVGMRLRGLIGMHSRLALVAVGSVSVVSGLLMLTSLVLLSGLVVMLGGFAAMHRRFHYCWFCYSVASRILLPRKGTSPTRRYTS